MTHPSQPETLSKLRLSLIATVLGFFVLIGLVVCLVRFGGTRDSHRTGPIEYEVVSDFSHIRVRRQENVRTLLFVTASGREAIESQVDLDEPYRLLLPYTQYMFVSYLFVPQQQNALIVGLGGGGMVHYIARHDPSLTLDVVEIDPVIVRLADEYFQVRSEATVRIINADALEFLQDDGDSYDAIYMDAFLGASDATDVSGVPLHLKTARFFQLVQSRLDTEGVVVFNLHRHRNHGEDVRAIRAAFGQVYVFRVPSSGNVIVAASMSEERLNRQSILQRADDLDRRFQAGASFSQMIGSMDR